MNDKQLADLEAELAALRHAVLDATRNPAALAACQKERDDLKRQVADGSDGQALADGLYSLSRRYGRLNSESVPEWFERWKKELDAAEARAAALAGQLAAAREALNGPKMTISVGPGGTRRDEWYVLGWADARAKAIEIVNAAITAAPGAGEERAT